MNNSYEQLFNIAYNYCDNIGDDSDLERVINYMQDMLEERKRLQEEIDKASGNNDTE
ncbi:MAG: hypothetical protein IJO32_07985 [Bacilli bacterium]|nr:hypothetical protein [Bacilli bacterium]